MRPQMSQSVGTSQTLAKQRGHRKPSLLSSEWQTHKLGGEVSGNLVGNPIIIRSAARLVAAPDARETARCAGGGTDSNSRSLKWPSFIATPNWPTLIWIRQHRAIRKDGYLPPVLSQRSLQIFISAARATTETRILLLTQSSRVSWMLPGSHVVNEPKMIRISRDEWVGRWLSKVRYVNIVICANKPHGISCHFDGIL